MYDQGMKLIRRCNQTINEVEKKILVLVRMEKSMNFKEEYTDRVEKIEKILKKYLPEKKGYQRTIMEAMEYSLMAGGKRLRPMLWMGELQTVWRRRSCNRTVYGCH